MGLSVEQRVWLGAGIFTLFANQACIRPSENYYDPEFCSAPPESVEWLMNKDAIEPGYKVSTANFGDENTTIKWNPKEGSDTELSIFPKGSNRFISYNSMEIESMEIGKISFKLEPGTYVLRLRIRYGGCKEFGGPILGIFEVT